MLEVLSMLCPLPLSISERYARREPLARRRIAVAGRLRCPLTKRRKYLAGQEESVGGSRKRFQLVERKPSALTLGGLNSVPVWCDNHNHHVGVSGKIGHVGSGTKWRGLQANTRSFDPLLHLMAQRIYSLLEI